MDRILIIGSSGAGKTTLATWLGRRLDLPVIHLDSHYWRSNWTVPLAEEWRTRVSELVQGDKWVMDGNFGGSLDIRLPACDTIIFLDFPRRISLWRILKRWAQWHGHTRPDLAPDCSERLNWEFLRWVWNFPRETRPKILEKIRPYRTGKNIIILKNPAEVKQFGQKLPNR
jgi:adenylate kinase family enzyme